MQEYRNQEEIMKCKLHIVIINQVLTPINKTIERRKIFKQEVTTNLDSKLNIKIQLIKINKCFNTNKSMIYNKLIIMKTQERKMNLKSVIYKNLSAWEIQLKQEIGMELSNLCKLLRMILIILMIYMINIQKKLKTSSMFLNICKEKQTQEKL